MQRLRQLQRNTASRTGLVVGTFETRRTADASSSAASRRCCGAPRPTRTGSSTWSSRPPNGEGVLPGDLLGKLLEPRRQPAALGARPAGAVPVHADHPRGGHAAPGVGGPRHRRDRPRRPSYSERTVKNVLHEITTRLQLRNRAHAVGYALRQRAHLTRTATRPPDASGGHVVRAVAGGCPNSAPRASPGSAPPPCRVARRRRRMAGVRPDAAGQSVRGGPVDAHRPGGPPGGGPGPPRPGRLGAPRRCCCPAARGGLTAASGGQAADATPGPRRPAAGTPGTRIAYAGTGHRSLGTVATTTSSTPLFGAGPAHYDDEPSALGDQMVFASRRDEKTPQVYLRAADGSVRTSHHGMDAAHPRLTPDGQSVVFDAAGSGGPDGGTQRDLWLVRTDGTGLTRLTDTPADETAPTVSPDGTRLAYSSDGGRAGGRQIYVRPAGGGAATRITDPANGTATEPAWNPVNDASPPGPDRVHRTTAGDGQSGPRLRVAPRSAATTAAADGGARATVACPRGGLAARRGRRGVPEPETTCDVRGRPTTTCSGRPRTSTQPPALVLSEDREVASAHLARLARRRRRGGRADLGGPATNVARPAGRPGGRLRPPRPGADDPQGGPGGRHQHRSRQGPAVPAGRRVRPVDRAAELHARRTPDRA